MKNVMMFLFFLILSAFCLIPNALSACEKHVRVIDFPPYSIKKDRSWEGLNITISHRLLEAIGCRPSYVSLPFARALALLKTGEVDMVLQLTETEERKSYASFIGPIYNEKLILATRKTISHPIRSLSDIVDYKLHIGVQRGLHMGTDFQHRYADDAKFRESFVMLSAVEPLLPMMKKNRIDGFFIDELHFNYLKNSTPNLSELSKQPFVVHESAVYIGLSKKSFSQQQIEIMTDTLDKLNKQSS